MKENQWFAIAPLVGKIFIPKQAESSDREEGAEPTPSSTEQNQAAQKPLLKLMNEWCVDFPIWTEEHYPAEPENFPELPSRIIDDLHEWAALFNSADPDSKVCWISFIDSKKFSRRLSPEDLRKIRRYRELRSSLLRQLTAELGDRYRIELID